MRTAAVTLSGGRGWGSAACLVTLIGALSACASGGGKNLRAGDEGAVRAALEGRTPASAGPVNQGGRPVAYVVLGGGDGAGELVAFDLAASRVLWRQRADVASRVSAGRSVVVHPTRSGALVGRDAATGAVRWERELEGSWIRVGHAVDGDDVYEVWEPAGAKVGTGPREAWLVALDGRSGGQRWIREIQGPAAGPAARDGLVAVPHRSQFVTLFGRDGDALAEVLARDEAATFVVGLPEGMVYGSRGLYRLGPETAAGRRGGPGYLQAKVPAFVRALYHRDMYQAVDAAYSAQDRNRLLWRLRPEQAAFLDDRVVVHNFRFFFGIDARTGKLDWAYSHPRTDAMAAHHTGPAIVFVSSEGQVGALDARTGRLTYQASLGGDGPMAVVGATFDADGFSPPGGAGGGSALPAVLSSIVWDPDRRFADVKLFAVEELAALPGPEVTRELLKALDSNDLVPTPVVRRAMEALVARQDRSMLGLYIEALKVHPDFAEGRQPRRLDVYARAVAALKAPEAVPALVEHLRLPDTDPDVVRDLAQAAITTGAKEAVEAFSDYLLQYRADPAFGRAPTPLLAACDVLLALGGGAGRGLLLFVAEEPRTLPAVAAHIKRALAADEAP